MTVGQTITTDMVQIRNNFKSVARPEFGTVSGQGTADAPFRIAIGGKRRYVVLAALVAKFGGHIDPTKGQYPELARIIFELPASCEKCAWLNHKWLPCECECHEEAL